MPNPQETATFAGGCFWCVEAIFKELEGVDRVNSGYTGGSVANPSYEAVCTGGTGHAEAIEILFNPAAISYRELVEVFFAFHDPTTLNQQGPDTGTQYRSAIYYHTDAQRDTAKAVIDELTRGGVFNRPIVTELVPAGPFYAADQYHQDYYARNQYQPYCALTITPKVAKLRKKYAAKLKGRATRG